MPNLLGKTHIDGLGRIKHAQFQATSFSIAFTYRVSTTTVSSSDLRIFRLPRHLEIPS